MNLTEFNIVNFSYERVDCVYMSESWPAANILGLKKLKNSAELWMNETYISMTQNKGAI